MSRAQQLVAPAGYVSGHHFGPTPERCTEFYEMPNGAVVQCTHASHQKPAPQSEPTPTPAPVAPVVGRVELDLPEVEYHAHPALSSSGAKLLLALPSRFRHVRDHGQAPKKAFDFGSLAHLKVLGKGSEVVVVDAENWTTKAAKEKRDEARAAGLIPALRKDVDQADAMAEAVLEHPAARELFERGVAEQSLFWTDPATGVPMRARTDWWRPGLDGARGIVGDYKTAAQSVDPRNVPRIIHSWGYAIQADWYLRGIRELGLDADPIFLFVLQEKTPPYPVTVVELDDEALRVGREKTDQALRLWLQCNETGRWPGYSDEVELISLPGYAIAEHDNAPRADADENYAYDPDEPDDEENP